jgi:hypothetical protein
VRVCVRVQRSAQAFSQAHARVCARRRLMASLSANALSKRQSRNIATLPGEEQRKLAAAQSVAFMYQKPPGYDAMREREALAAAAAARAAEAAAAAAAATAGALEGGGGAEGGAFGAAGGHRFAKDAFGRRVPTAAEFPSLANAPHEPGCVCTCMPSRHTEHTHTSCWR